jgi:hypothetical protein
VDVDDAVRRDVDAVDLERPISEGAEVMPQVRGIARVIPGVIAIISSLPSIQPSPSPSITVRISQ